MLLFRAETQPSQEIFEADPTMGWEGYIVGGLEIETTPGSHGFHIKEPHVAVLAGKLGTAIEKARTRMDGGLNGSEQPVATPSHTA